LTDYVRIAEHPQWWMITVARAQVSGFSTDEAAKYGLIIDCTSAEPPGSRRWIGRVIKLCDLDILTPPTHTTLRTTASACKNPPESYK